MIKIYKLALGKIYEIVGHNWLTVKLSQLLDILIVKEQRKELQKWKNQKKLQEV